MCEWFVIHDNGFRHTINKQDMKKENKALGVYLLKESHSKGLHQSVEGCLTHTFRVAAL